MNASRVSAAVLALGVLPVLTACSPRLFESYDEPAANDAAAPALKPSEVARHREEAREKREARAEAAGGTGRPVSAPAAATPVAANAAATPSRARWSPPKDDGPLVEVASFDQQQATGVAVSKSGRVFVSFPRWDAPYVMGVAEVLANGTARGYPDADWNKFSENPATPPDGDHFVCVQSVYIDDQDDLWVLDPASPNLAGVVRGDSAGGGGGGPKLVHIDLATNSVIRTYRFDAAAAPDKSYLNDVRIDTRDGVAFMTDSGLGAIVVLDLHTGAARRLLEDHPAVKADPSVVPVVEGRELRFKNENGLPGAVPQIHADGLALDSKGGFLYWQALIGNHMYRIDTRFLKSPTALPYQVADAIEDLGETVVADGLEADRLGNVYIAAIELSGIAAHTRRGDVKVVSRDERFSWPDSLAIGPAGPQPEGQTPPAGKWLYFTTSQINRTKWFNADAPQQPLQPYRVWRMRISEP